MTAVGTEAVEMVTDLTVISTADGVAIWVPPTAMQVESVVEALLSVASFSLVPVAITTSSVTAFLAVASALTVDLLVGEPRTERHPVAWFGSLVDAADRDWSGGDGRARSIGLAIAVFLPIVPASVAWSIVGLGRVAHPVAEVGAAALVLFFTLSLRSLLETSRTVLHASESNPERARSDVRALVGRDADGLSPGEIRSAAVESAGENLSDGFVATVLPFAVIAPVSLPVAAAVAAWVKGVNTLDSMLGYPSKPIGTAAARLDDVVMWIPARVTAGAIAAVALDPRVLWRAHRWAHATPSPNAGWPMATLACALGVRLEKPGVYVLNPNDSLPSVEDGDRALAVVGLAAAFVVTFVAVLALYSPPIAAWVSSVDLVALSMAASGGVLSMAASGGVLSMAASGGVLSMVASGGVLSMVASGGVLSMAVPTGPGRPPPSIVFGTDRDPFAPLADGAESPVGVGVLEPGNYSNDVESDRSETFGGYSA